MIFAVILLITKAAEIYLGEKGIFITSFFAGLADVDAITLSISGLTRLGGSISLNTGKVAVILATMSNTLAKGTLVYYLGSKLLRKFVLPVIVLMLVIGVSFILLV